MVAIYPPRKWKVEDDSWYLMKPASLKGCMQIEFIWGKILQVSKFGLKRVVMRVRRHSAPLCVKGTHPLPASLSLFLLLKGKLISFVNAAHSQVKHSPARHA